MRPASPRADLKGPWGGRALQVGVCGSHESALLLAVAMRDYGRHSVIGLGLPDRTADREATQLLDQLPIPRCLDAHHLVGHAATIFYLDPAPPAALFTAMAERDRSEWLLVLPTGTHPTYRREVARMSPPACRVAAMDLSGDSLERFLSPAELRVEILDGTADDARTVEILWRPITNTVPFTWGHAPKVSPTGFLWPSSALWVGPRVSTPPA